MNSSEVLIALENFEQDFMNQELGNEGHIIFGFEVLLVRKAQYEINLIAKDTYRGTEPIKKSVTQYLKEGR